MMNEHKSRVVSPVQALRMNQEIGQTGRRHREGGEGSWFRVDKRKRREEVGDLN